MSTQTTWRLRGSTMDVPVTMRFETIYRLEYPGLLAVATALMGDRLDGEDAVQDTMVKAFVHWPKVSLLERPGAWCHRVLTNACHSRWRRRRTEQRWLSRQRRTESYHEPFDLDVIAFWAFVRTMPERPRTVVALFYGAGLTSLEISEIINVPHGTVRSDLSRARTLLARELGEV